ncbi:hypothetical protein ACLOJK_019799 [Asimina triloba]
MCFIAVAFLLSTLFSDVKTATDNSFPSWILVMELFPGFSLYRGLYEFAQYAFIGNYMGTNGMRWRDLNDDQNGMRAVLIIMFIEWLVLLPFAFYSDQVASMGSGIRKHPLFFLQYFRRKPAPTFREPKLQRQVSKVLVEMEKPDVAQQREVVNQLLLEPSTSHAIICDNLKKVYPGKDGNPEKFAVQGLSLALPRGECFGMLGPNGAGKTSFINMIGHHLLWETLTGREHLLFYGRLKNLKGSALTHSQDIEKDVDQGKAVEESLKSVNLFHGGVGDKRAGKYSGGMKRRLSVAISLIGYPKVVYMDEPSTGLDPASRNNLWNVVKQAKQDRAIILTKCLYHEWDYNGSPKSLSMQDEGLEARLMQVISFKDSVNHDISIGVQLNNKVLVLFSAHSMEEAEVLCDRLGIFVDGSLQCIGNPKELKARYGGSYVFTMTTSSDDEEEVENLVRRLSPSANRIYHISGTQKFELPKQEVRIADVFQAVEKAKRRLTIHAWGLADTTLEDVFIKVARGAQSFNVLS